jgi:hypothetical protein
MKCGTFEIFNFQFAQCQKFWKKKPKGLLPLVINMFFFFFFPSIAHILLLIHDMVSNFGGE